IYLTPLNPSPTSTLAKKFGKKNIRALTSAHTSAQIEAKKNILRGPQGGYPGAVGSDRGPGPSLWSSPTSTLTRNSKIKTIRARTLALSQSKIKSNLTKNIPLSPHLDLSH